MSVSLEIFFPMSLALTASGGIDYNKREFINTVGVRMSNGRRANGTKDKPRI